MAVHDRGMRDMMSETRKITKKMIKRIFAICVATPSTPRKPKIPATIAMIKNIKAQYSIGILHTPSILTLRVVINCNFYPKAE
jgi:hypothetical protein